MNFTIGSVNTKRTIETKIARIASLVEMYNVMYEFQFHNRFINMSLTKEFLEQTLLELPPLW